MSFHRPSYQAQLPTPKAQQTLPEQHPVVLNRLRENLGLWHHQLVESLVYTKVLNIVMENAK